MAAGFFGFALNNHSRRACQTVGTVEDEAAELAESFTLSLQHYLRDPLVTVEPSIITFNVIDDDGKKNNTATGALLKSHSFHSLSPTSFIHTHLHYSHPHRTHSVGSRGESARKCH